MADTDSLDDPLINDSGNLQEAASAEHGKPVIPYRYKLFALSCMGMASAISLRSNFNIALVAMVNYTSLDNYTSNECPEPGNIGNVSHQQKEGVFTWDSSQQSLLLGGFFYGYVLTQFIGGYVAEITGPKIVLLLTVLGPSILNILTPPIANWNFYALFISRILMGILQGSLYPANNALLSRWAPDKEKTILYVVSTSGSSLGSIASPLVTGVLCNLSLFGGWPLSFYLFGGLGIIWSILWMFVAHNGPNDHPGLSEYEKQYITKGRSYASKNMKFNRPWLSFFTSSGTWAIFVFTFFDGMAYYALYSGVPIYMKQILRFDISQDGVLYALPFLGMFIFSFLGGFSADWLRKYYLSTRITRKLICVLGEGSQVAFILGIAFVPCNRVVAVTLYMCAMTFIGLSAGGPSVNWLDIAPKYAGTLMGISNLLANIGGFLSPLIVGAITKDSPNQKDWQLVFFLTAGSYALATLGFVLLSKGEEQPWAKDSGLQQPVITTVNGDITPPALNSDIAHDVNGVIPHTLPGSSVVPSDIINAPLLSYADINQDPES